MIEVGINFINFTSRPVAPSYIVDKIPYVGVIEV